MQKTNSNSIISSPILLVTSIFIHILCSDFYDTEYINIFVCRCLSLNLLKAIEQNSTNNYNNFQKVVECLWNQRLFRNSSSGIDFSHCVHFELLPFLWKKIVENNRKWQYHFFREINGTSQWTRIFALRLCSQRTFFSISYFEITTIHQHISKFTHKLWNTQRQTSGGMHPVAPFSHPESSGSFQDIGLKLETRSVTHVCTPRSRFNL